MPSRRRIREGEEYTVDEEDEIELEEAARNPEPDVEVQGEPWGWTKPGPKPRGWLEDGNYDNGRERGDPGPFDGEWERPR